MRSARRSGSRPRPLAGADQLTGRSPLFEPGKSSAREGMGSKRPTVEGLRATYRWYPQAGIGLLLGPGVRVVDLEVDDAERARAVLERIFPAGMPQTLGRA